MRISTLIIVAFVAVPPDVSRRLHVTPVPLQPAMTQSVIVGRSVCGGSTWLLTRSADLIRLGRESRTPTVRRVRDLRPDDSFWGLACLDDGSLWTLATGHVLARMTPDGAIVERVVMVMPQVEVFGAQDRLVLLGLPIVLNRPVLSAGPRSSPGTVRPWPGLVGRAGFGNSPALATNLVGCGIGFASWIPCWFVDQSRVSISNGTIAREVRMPWLTRPDVDRTAPIRDVALIPDGSMWVLAASSTPASNGRRVSQRLSRVGPSGDERQSVALAPAVRLIVWADASGCVLLTVNGSLLRVSESGGSK